MLLKFDVPEHAEILQIPLLESSNGNRTLFNILGEKLYWTNTTKPNKVVPEAHPATMPYLFETIVNEFYLLPQELHCKLSRQLHIQS